MAYNDFVQSIANAIKDALTLDDVVNGEPNTQAKSRLGRLIYSLSTINHRVDIATNQANQKLTELQDAINAAAAAGAGANGWSTSLVLDTAQNMTQADINAAQKTNNDNQSNINARFINSKDKQTVQQVIDALDTDTTNTIKRGVVYFNPLDEIELQSAINLKKFRAELNGRNSVLKRSTTDSSEAMIRVYDSSYSKINNFVLLGNPTNPPLAAILFDNDNKALKGTNEKNVVENVSIGRKYLADTDTGASLNSGTPYGKVQNGILVRSGGYGNNDEHTFRNVAVSDATVAGFNFDGDQHIWSSIENCLANGCDVGYRLGSNVTMYNVQANRNTTADLLGIRNIEVGVYGFFSEHTKLAIKSTSSSFYITSGKILKNSTTKEPIIHYLSGGVLSLRGVTIASTSPQNNYIDFTAGNVKSNGVYIKECNISGGDKRGFYKLHTANASALTTVIDITVDDFVFSTSAPYADETKTAQTVAINNTSVVYSSSQGSKIVYGKYIHSAIGSTLGTNVQVPVCLDASVNRVRVFNRDTANALTIPDTQVRSMDLAGHILQNILATATDMSFTAKGVVRVNIPLFGVKLGDYIIPTTTTLQNTYVIYGYATADNQASVIVESISTVSTNLVAQIVGAAKFNEHKARYHAVYKSASAITTVASKAVLTFDVNCNGVQVGSHCLVAPCVDLGNLLITAHCNVDNSISVVIYNTTSTSIDIPANTFFKVCAIF